MEDLNDIFKEPEEGQGVVIGNTRWCVRDGRATIHPVDVEPIKFEIKQGAKNFIEDLDAALGEEDDTMTLLTKIELLNDEIIAWEERWKKLKEKIEIERGCIRASEDDGVIRVGQFRTLNSIDNFIKELEGKNG